MSRISSGVKNVIKRAMSGLGMTVGWERNFVEFGRFRTLLMAYEDALNAASHAGARIPGSDARFELIRDLRGTNPYEAYAIIEALAQVRDLGGDVCDFGAGEGRVSALVANEIAATGSILHLFDSFQGLSKPTPQDRLLHDVLSLGSIEAYEGKLRYPPALVESRLRRTGFPQDRYVVHAGFIEQVIPAGEGLPSKVSFAYLDCDFYEPVKVALQYLQRVAAVGAVIIVDDYDYFTTGAKIAVQEWLAEAEREGQEYDVFVPDPKLADFVRLTRTA